MITVTMCRGGDHAQPAVIGPHLHWNGAFYAICHAGADCMTPSCHPASGQRGPDADQDREEREQELVAALDRVVADAPDEWLPHLIDVADEWLTCRSRRSPACRRELARQLAEGIARSPGMSPYKNAVGRHDAILDPQTGKPTGYRMQDFIAEEDLATYRTWSYGSPEATEEHPCDEPPPEVADCAGDCKGGHWGPDGWHYTKGMT